MEPGVIALLIPIVAILAGCGVGFTWIYVRHRERMAMIEAGMHPDDPDHEPFDEPFDSRPERIPAAERAERAELELRSPGRVPYAED